MAHLLQFYFIQDRSITIMRSSEVQREELESTNFALIIIEVPQSGYDMLAEKLEETQLFSRPFIKL